MTKLVMAMVILVISNVMAWWQLNAQFTESLKGHWFWSSANWMALFGIPIGSSPINPEGCAPIGLKYLRLIMCQFLLVK